MRTARTFAYFLLIIFSALSCSGNKAEDPESPQGHQTGFAKGADISWITKMESTGMKFANSKGESRECTALMKEIGFNAIRLRVWVNPSDGFCGKEDVLAKALRVKKQGMKLMIDFHYSDTWADPGNQTPPAEWRDFDAEQMAKAVGDHTKEVLHLLKENGVAVHWVQVGNEVNQGMLHPLGQIKDRSAGNFPQLFNAGYNAVKSVYPEAEVILHVSNGQDAELFSWFFSLMQSTDIRYDLIGMSLYPSWWENGGWTTGWQGIMDRCLANIRSLTGTYGKPVMICETGMPCSKPAMSRQAMQYLLDQTRLIDGCKGVFYWEPEAPEGYNNGYGLGAFSKHGTPTAALDPFKN